MPPVKNTPARLWVFTINNPESNNIPESWKTLCKYCTWQLEKGEEGTPHLQGALSLLKPARLAAMKKLNPNAHWEVTRSESHALDYSHKEETRIEGPWSYGEVTQQGKRSDLLAVKDALDAGSSISQVYQAHFAASARYHKFFKEYKRTIVKPRDFKTEVAVLIGPTGTGKTQFAHETFPDAYWLPQGKWFDDYDAHKVVIIDEFYGWLPYSFLLRLLDRYPLLVETKFGHVHFVAEKVIITSNKHPRDWYDIKCDYPTLERRFTTIQSKEKLEEEFVQLYPSIVDE